MKGFTVDLSQKQNPYLPPFTMVDTGFCVIGILMNKGWISIHRKIKHHWLWDSNRVFSELDAWLDLLLQATHESDKVKIGNKLFVVNRGEQIRSLKTLATEWNWTRSRVKRFLELLQSDNMIELKNETVTTRITICNYDVYQQQRNASETQVKRIRNASETQVNTDNNVNNDNNENKDIHTADSLTQNIPKYDRSNYPATEQECIDEGNMIGVPAVESRIFFHKLESNHWLQFHKQSQTYIPVRNWRSMMKYHYDKGWLKEGDKRKVDNRTQGQKDEDFLSWLNSDTADDQNLLGS